jgi:hypothetical protein
MASPSPQEELPLANRSAHKLTPIHSLEDSPSSPSLIPSPLFLRRPSTSSQYSFRCTVCWKTSPSPCFTVGKRLQVVCRQCWKWMWSVSICWSCGEVVFRKTDAIGFGWCWWHWSCFSCLVCSVSNLHHLKSWRVLTSQFPLRPPNYLDSTNQPHENGMLLTEPPVCDRCMDSPDSIDKLEQHATLLREPAENSEEKSTNGNSPAAPCIAQTIDKCDTVQDPLEKQQASRPQDYVQITKLLRPVPPWMSLLPSNVNPHIKAPTKSSISRRITFPSYSSCSESTPYMTPLEWPISHDDYTGHHLETPPKLSLDGDVTPKAAERRKTCSSVDFANFLGHAEDLFSLGSDDSPTGPQPRPKKEAPLQNPTINRSDFLGNHVITTDPPFKLPSTFSRVHGTYSRSPRAASSKTSFPSLPTASGPTKPSLTPEDSAVPFSSTKSPHPYSSNPCASVSEASIPALYTLSSSSTKRSLSPDPSHLPNRDHRTLKLRKTSKHHNASLILPPQPRSLIPPTSPSKPPFLKELSIFFASRRGSSGPKLMLPSRAAERKGLGDVMIGLKFADGSETRFWEGCRECGFRLPSVDSAEEGVA